MKEIGWNWRVIPLGNRLTWRVRTTNGLATSRTAALVSSDHDIPEPTLSSFLFLVKNKTVRVFQDSVFPHYALLMKIASDKNPPFSFCKSAFSCVGWNLCPELNMGSGDVHSEHHLSRSLTTCVYVIVFFPEIFVDLTLLSAESPLSYNPKRNMVSPTSYVPKNCLRVM